MVTLKEIRQMTGKLIQWEEHVCQKSGFGILKTGTVLEVKGKNILVDTMGTTDWKWFPQMHNVKAVQENSKPV